MHDDRTHKAAALSHLTLPLDGVRPWHRPLRCGTLAVTVGSCLKASRHGWTRVTKRAGGAAGHARRSSRGFSDRSCRWTEPAEASYPPGATMSTLGGSDEQSEKPIFIVGTMRSGSTLLRLILDTHKNIAIGEETGFMGALTTNKAIPNWRYGRDWYGRLGWNEEEFDNRLRDFYGGMFQRYAAGQGKARWGDKTPLHSWHMQEMARIFPDAVFLGIVRHPGAVVFSLKKRFQYDAHEAADYWENTNAEILRQGIALGTSRFALVRYEDVVLHPEATLQEVVDWLGESWSPDLLRHHEVQAAKGAPRRVDGKTNSRDPINPQRVDRWVESLAAADQDVVCAATGRLAEFLGYDPTGSALPRDVVAENPAGFRRLLPGGALASLFQREGAPRLEPRRKEIVAAEMSPDELIARLRQAESSLARIRARRLFRVSDAFRRAQRRVSLPVRASPLARLRRTGSAPDARR